MKVFVDTSVVLRRVLGQPGAFLNWAQWELAVCSELLQVEMARTLDRLRIANNLKDTDLADLIRTSRMAVEGFHEVPVQPSVLKRAASAFPTVVRTLDSIHLSTALLWMEDTGQDLVFATHDGQLATAAKACGLEVLL